MNMRPSITSTVVLSTLFISFSFSLCVCAKPVLRHPPPSILGSKKNDPKATDKKNTSGGTESTEAKTKQSDTSNSNKSENNSGGKADKSPPLAQWELLINTAADAQDKKEWDRSLKILQHAYENFPHNELVAVAYAKNLDAVNKTESAIKLLRSFQSKHSESSLAIAWLGELYFLSGNYKESGKYMELVLKHHPEDSRASYRLAQLALIENDPERAKTLLQAIVKNETSMSEAYFLLARILARASLFPEANNNYAKAGEIDSNNAVIFAEQAAVLLADGKTLPAIDRLLHARKLAPESVELLKQLIVAYGAWHDWPNAADYTQSWTQMEPNNPQAFLFQSWCLLKMGEYGDALQAIKKGINLAPLDPQMHIIKGFILYEQRKVDDAIASFNEALRFSSNEQRSNPQIQLTSLINLAQAYANQSEMYLANETLAKLRDLSPNGAETKSVESYILALQRNFLASRRLAQESLNQKPDLALSLMALALCEQAEGKGVEAVNRLKKLSRLEPDSSFVLNELAKAELANGNTREALNYAQQALQIAPQNLHAKAVFAQILIARGNYAGAIPLLKECIVRNQKNVQLRLILASAQKSSGDKESAEETLLKAWKLFPSEAAIAVGLAELSLDRKAYAAATDFVEEAMRINASDAAAHILTAKIYLAQGRASEAIDALNFFKDDLNDFNVALLRGRAYFLLSKYSKSSNDYETVFEAGKMKEPGDFFNYSMALIRKGDLVSAERVLATLVKNGRNLSAKEITILRRLKSQVSRKNVMYTN